MGGFAVGDLLAAGTLVSMYTGPSAVHLLVNGSGAQQPYIVPKRNVQTPSATRKPSMSGLITG